MSQQAVASRMVDAGHSWRQTTVAKTERAARPIRVNEVASLARIFGVSPSTLLDEADMGSELHGRLLRLEARRMAALKRIHNHKWELEMDTKMLKDIEEQLAETKRLWEGKTSDEDEEASFEGRTQRGHSPEGLDTEDQEVSDATPD